MDAPIFLQLSANDFRVGTNGKNNNFTRNSSRSNILTLLTLLNTDAKFAVLRRVLS